MEAPPDSGPTSEPPKDDQPLPTIVAESLDYLLQLELSSRDMSIPAPLLDASPEPITGMQDSELQEQIIQLRSEMLTHGTEIKQGERSIFTLRNDRHEAFTSNPNDATLGTDRVFWIIRHGNEDQPDIFFNYYKATSGLSFDLDIEFTNVPDLNPPAKYESGRKKTSNMEPQEYNVAHFAINETHKLIDPSKHAVD